MLQTSSRLARNVLLSNGQDNGEPRCGRGAEQLFIGVWEGCGCGLGRAERLKTLASMGVRLTSFGSSPQVGARNEKLTASGKGVQKWTVSTRIVVL